LILTPLGTFPHTPKKKLGEFLPRCLRYFSRAV
jgi:hypothetical protein